LFHRRLCLWDGLAKQAVGWFGKELHGRNLVKMTELSVDVYKAAMLLLGSRGVQGVSRHLPGSVKGAIRSAFHHDEWKVSKNQSAQSLILL
jgi:hypothetical protein